LVAYPSYLASTASLRRRSHSAGRLYAVAGWMGSALGIGMAEDLRRIPLAFVLGAAVLFFAPRFWHHFAERKREFLVTVALLLSAWVFQCALASLDAKSTASNPSTLV